MRYLTKSRFKLAMDCPTKLYYTGKPKEYFDNALDDEFLKALADGGFQVGELAKCYYPEGIEVGGLDYDSTWVLTQEHLKKENVTLFEAAIKFNNLFVRVDILKKTGNRIELIEVKAKSFSSSTFKQDLWQKRNPDKLDSSWVEYVYDVAFQAYVIKNAFPQFHVQSFLMCTDKDKVSSVDGLNQRFLIQKDEKGRSKVIRKGNTELAILGEPILTAIDITDAVFKIHNDIEPTPVFEELGFRDAVAFFAEKYAKDERIMPLPGAQCKSCQFRGTQEGLKSGFNECFKLGLGMTAEELSQPLAMDVWFRPKVPDDVILMDDIDQTHLVVKPNDKGDGMSRSERQWLQVQKHQNRDSTEYRNQKAIDRMFSTFTYPLHFIDFETCMAAIPFNKGRRPYEQIAFQFSHHIMHKNGEYEHAGEWIEVTPGKFPNFDFVRALKAQLEKDDGTIFRYSNHENTVLNQIAEQLAASDEVDRDELIAWIGTITHKGAVVGKRDMVDLCKVIIDYYYHPETKGSNSIKYVLPAILKAQGKADDPYKELPPVFEDWHRDELDLLMSGDDIRNGGAALTAYALMQFTEMSEVERQRIKDALLRYCKLDTEAMVWIYQYLSNSN